jgi:hypothetical protein
LVQEVKIVIESDAKRGTFNSSKEVILNMQLFKICPK